MQIFTNGKSVSPAQHCLALQNQFKKFVIIIFKIRIKKVTNDSTIFKHHKHKNFKDLQARSK